MNTKPPLLKNYLKSLDIIHGSVYNNYDFACSRLVMGERVKVGCCGFPRGMKPYLSRFRLVEVQQTFYKLPRMETVVRWRQQAPDDFEFIIKAWQVITHPPSSPAYYFRLHGGPGYRYSYTNDELGYLRRMAANKESYVLFNNVTMYDDALRFINLLQEKRRVEERRSLSYITASPLPYKGGDKGGGLLNKNLRRVGLLNNLAESQVIKIWQHLLLDGTQMTTQAGESIRIIYPGRINDDRGADFRDAVVAIGERLIKGDVEVHVKSSDWQVHRHHHDPVYNRVVLHVVMWHDSDINLQNGKRVPVVELRKYTGSPTGQPPNLVYPSAIMPCLKTVGGLPLGIVVEFLDDAGEKRFLAKATRFEADLARIEAGQSLYRGIMGALGYSKNKLPFLELASRLPLRILESVAQGSLSDEECLARQQALLLGTAGLLPAQRPNWHQDKGEWMDKLERLWASYRQTEAMSWDAWHLFKVRPNNFPVRRIVAMSYLILGYRETGILEGLVNIVKEVPVSRGYYRLEKGLLVTAAGYWASHFDFGLGSRIGSLTLLGNQRAADIVVNVLLPFTFAWGKVTSQPELKTKAFDLYRHYPKPVVNTVERHMKRQLRLSNSLVNSAQRQQGLIHIYNSQCTQGKCYCCPLGKVG